MLGDNSRNIRSEGNRNIRINIIPIQQLQLPRQGNRKERLARSQRPGQPNRTIQENLVKERARAQQRKTPILRPLVPRPKGDQQSPPDGGRSRRRGGDILTHNQLTRAFTSHMKKMIINMEKKFTPKGTGM
jgi:hypothetical protein